MAAPYTRRRKLKVGDRVYRSEGDGRRWGTVTTARKVDGCWLWKITWDGAANETRPLWDGSVSMKDFHDEHSGAQFR